LSSSLTLSGGLWNSTCAQRFGDGFEEGGLIHNQSKTYSVRAIRQF